MKIGYATPPTYPQPARTGNGVTQSFMNTLQQTKSQSTSAPAQTPGFDAAYRNRIIRDAEADPQYAERTAYDFAHDTWSLTGPLVNIKTDPMTYSFTGEPVTADSMAAFKSQAASAHAEKLAIYQAEKSKGTPAADILKKLYAVTNNQGDNYLHKIGWIKDDNSASKTGTTAPDFTRMTRKDLFDWMNSKIKAGELSFDDSSTFLAMTIKFSPDGSSTGLDDKEHINFMQQASNGLEGARSRNDQAAVTRLQKTLALMQQFQQQPQRIDLRA